MSLGSHLHGPKVVLRLGFLDYYVVLSGLWSWHFDEPRVSSPWLESRSLIRILYTF